MLLALLVRDAPEPELEASIARMTADAADPDDAYRLLADGEITGRAIVEM